MSMKTKILTAVACMTVLTEALSGVTVNAEKTEMGAAIARQINDEGVVLLKNENNALPLAKGATVALFGEGQADHFDTSKDSLQTQTGYIPFISGSTRSLNGEPVVAPLNAFRAYQKEGAVKIYEPLSQQYEKKATYVPDDAMIDAAAAEADTAIMFVSRWGGECIDFKKADWNLSKNEKTVLTKISAKFKKVVVVLNTGSAIDTNWAKGTVDGMHADALLFAAMGGRQGGWGIADIITGKVNPSGKLVSTFASALEDYPTNDAFFKATGPQNYTEDIFVGYRYFETFAPEKVNYEFGFGLSYTTFGLRTAFAEKDGIVTVKAEVTNTGSVAGKEIVQVYFSAPQGKLGKAAKELCAFEKTKLLAPGEKQTLIMKINVNDLAAFDDLGKTGHASAYVLEAGDYRFFAGTSVKNVGEIGSYHVDELRVTEQLTAQCETNLKERLLADGTMEKLPEQPKTDEAPAAEAAANPEPREKNSKLSDVTAGTITLDEFVAQMTTAELATFFISYPGNKAGTSTEMIKKYGLAQFQMSDGSQGCGGGSSSYPCETILACTWNKRLAEAYGMSIGSEAYTSNIDQLLIPAMNIQRHPLSGRNAEYFSEDPFVTGCFGTLVVTGVQQAGVGACVKHFACNEIEKNKLASDSRVSERALREIYLRGFRMAVTQAKPWGVMSSYNLINGTASSENGDLLINILRKEWGFEGFVTGDWNNDKDAVKEVNNGNNVREPAGFCDINVLLKAIGSGKISRETLETGAKQVLWVIMRTHNFSKKNETCGGQHTYEDHICTKCFALDPDRLTELKTIEENLRNDTIGFLEDDPKPTAAPEEPAEKTGCKSCVIPALAALIPVAWVVKKRDEE